MEGTLIYLQPGISQHSSCEIIALVRFFLYPFIAAQVALEMTAAEGRKQVRNALQHLVVDTLSDTKEINELKAEIAVLRSEINQLRYERNSQNGNTRVSSR